MDLPPPSASWDLSDPAALFALDPIGDDLFQSRTRVIDVDPHIFGGQVIAQALSAASATVSAAQVHSLHGYFLKAGNGDHRLHLKVERVRDGARFSNRRVTVSQGGNHLFEMLCSFHVPLGSGPTHQIPMPEEIPEPEGLESLHQALEQTGDAALQNLLVLLSSIRGVEVRPCGLFGVVSEGKPLRRFWVRIPGAAGLEDTAQHLPLLAFLTDYWLAGGTLAAHQNKLGLRYPRMLSLDHSIWFHQPSRADDWLLYSVDSPYAAAGTGLARGQLYDRSGRLIVSSAQEVLIQLP